MRVLLASAYYAAALALVALLLASASLVTEGERALSRMESPEEKTDTLVKSWMERLTFGLYDGASEKARARARLEKDAGYHRDRVAATSLGLAALSAGFLVALLAPAHRGRRGARRALALHLQGVAAVCLLVGLAAPMLTVLAQREVALLGTVVLQFETKSILGTVGDLFAGGSVFVSILLAVFSIVVPVVKLLVSLLALMAPGARARATCVRFVRAVGKWSMTDVFVVAVLLAFLASTGNGLTDARLGPGLYFFAAYGLLTLAGSLLLARVAREPGLGAQAGQPPAAHDTAPVPRRADGARPPRVRGEEAPGGDR